MHLLMMIPGFDTVEMISKRLHLNTGDVKSVLQFLLKIGLATKTLKGYEASNKFLHLDKGSPIIGQLHANWRLKAVDVVRMDQPDNLHYSGVMTMSSSDFAKLKSMFTECLKEAVEVVKESKDEQLVVLGIDLFRL
ncbi:MAG: DUF4423 domain-containing protein [Proteobacteria bacterium]|nr:DUF4423 domain-containing protein [Pseudomonadota bacterium]